MKTRDLFDVVVKSVGLLFVVRAVDAGLGCIAIAMDPRLSLHDDRTLVIRLLVSLALALWFFYGAPPIQSLAFPGPRCSKRRALVEEPTPSVPEPEKPIPADGPPCVSCGERMPAGSKTCPWCGWTQPDAG